MPLEQEEQIAQAMALCAYLHIHKTSLCMGDEREEGRAVSVSSACR